MSPETRKEEGAPTLDELKTACARVVEKKLHSDFVQWLNLHEEIVWDHQRMDRKATNTPGWPDFSLFCNFRACFVEFKVPPNGLTDEQLAICRRLSHAGFAWLTTTSLSKAIEFAKEQLEI